MSNALYIACNIAIEDVIHRASSGVVVWNGVGGLINAAASTVRATSQTTFSVNITGRQVGKQAQNARDPTPKETSDPLTHPTYVSLLTTHPNQTITMPIYPTLATLLVFNLTRSLIATICSFSNYNAASALAISWDGAFETREGLRSALVCQRRTSNFGVP
ncbi:uncharacterized protein K452DRAFT_56301 [Aplosporella prunicola CBS 121167]|uniref:Uncharacterized protein n=1 Tax=Aplosporella prunicola CBS 121167 TaxID=1176127 RepID=A0A6A6BA71_9PEZI|nr:uncharacterized protein K452DRAFT_56301 [Aplosporella prunicola CBS 121167]KAF2139807.1 hypothetical protein K452DRAFT_56301 [Aplosporella prunicola CBS 121167]